MKIKYMQLLKAMDHLKYLAGVKDDAVMDIVVRDEDIGSGKLCDSIMITLSGVYPAGGYDSIKTSTTREYSLEVFADHENRNPKLTMVESRELEFKKD